jgi:cell division transport system permease protein
MAIHARYFLSESVRAFRKAKWLSLATVLTIGISLFLLGSLLGAFWYIHFLIVTGEEKMEMVAFMKDSYSSLDSAVTLRRQIELNGAVKEAFWVSKDSALFSFRKTYGSGMLEAIDENPLPASFHIQLHSAYCQSDSMEILKAAVAAIPGIEEVGYGEEWFPILEKVKKVYVGVVFFAGAILLFAFWWMVSNTIRFSVFARRSSIDIMRHIGATNAFIRIPFYLEGLFSGLAGSSLAIFLLLIARRFLFAYAPEVHVLDSFRPFLFSLIFFGGILLSLWISHRSLKKYLQ